MSSIAVESRAVSSVLGNTGMSVTGIQSALLDKRWKDHLSPEQIEGVLRRLEARGEVRCRNGLWYAVPAENWRDLPEPSN